MSGSSDIEVPCVSSDSISGNYVTRSIQCGLEEFRFDESSLVIKLCLLQEISDEESAETVSFFFYFVKPHSFKISENGLKQNEIITKTPRPRINIQERKRKLSMLINYQI